MVDMDAEDEPCVESVPTSSDADTDRQGRRSSDATIMSESEEETEEDVQATEKFSVGKDKKSYVEQGGRTEGTLSDHASGDGAQANGGSAVADGSRRGSKSRSNSGRSAGAPAGPAAIELLDAVLEQETADADAGAGSPAALKFNSPAMSQSTLREVDMASVRTSESTATFASGYSESTEGERTPTESTVKIGFETDSAMMKLLSRGIRIFNLNPKRGIEFIQANDLVHRVPNDDAGNARRIAIFLRHTRGLNKEQIGKVLGGENPQQIAILKYYFVQFDLSEYGPTVRGLERALRSVFECFKPPGESQKIERIVETFADKFNEDNRMIGAEPNPDAEFLPTTTFLLSYSIILLNVDLHNPNNPRKMLRREFISNLRGLDDGKDLPHEALSALYDRMSRHQMRHKVDRDEVAGDLFTHPDKAGWLQKKGPTRLSKWRPRWFILSESTLWYFKHSEDVDPQGFIPLENVLIRTCFDVPAPRGAAAARSSAAAPKTGVPQATAATVSTTAPLSMSLSAVPPDLMYSSEDEVSTPGSAKTSSGSGRRLVSRKSATMRFLPGSNPNSPTAAAASSASRQTRSRNFWFEMYMWDDRLNVKSARLSKRTGNFELGQHRTIKLRADSRQEMEQWVELLNRKGRFSQSLQDLTMRARFEQQLHPPRSFAGTPGPKMPNSHAHRKGMLAVSSFRTCRGYWLELASGDTIAMGNLVKLWRNKQLFVAIVTRIDYLNKTLMLHAVKLKRSETDEETKISDSTAIPSQAIGTPQVLSVPCNEVEAGKVTLIWGANRNDDDDLPLALTMCEYLLCGECGTALDSDAVREDKRGRLRMLREEVAQLDNQARYLGRKWRETKTGYDALAACNEELAAKKSAVEALSSELAPLQLWCTFCGWEWPASRPFAI
ncbi:Brefeldin A-inhibited guanine nucleotide-exchange protein 1 [Hondaea fermentalgiana]|uniref:Brefeldin A-inhibited guanine nucleotide-exchange protein 1 n=1 Tax=Hondaea fermentalgiana TaxID=2315210 RepID=A0A2R5GJN7_9STRA|nr:Brefeldin A-inhibited guanine nucleotide-exchange protein 1 [Hondaea fermentalgiana]|eukprot:GBG28863.1 Brefeldin A-inhibited guanine nucleotide-exchange protein 1 [Hondaea fermentalgiana]